MPTYEQKNLEGALFTNVDSTAIVKGPIDIDGTKKYFTLAVSHNQKGEPVHELLYSAGRIFHNAPEKKLNPKGPDLSGKIEIDGVSYKFAGWNNIASNGKEYVSAKLTKTEKSPF